MMLTQSQLDYAVASSIGLGVYISPRRLRLTPAAGGGVINHGLICGRFGIPRKFFYYYSHILLILMSLTTWSLSP